MDRHLRDLLDAAVGEPPHRVTAEAVRHRVIKRRVVECVAGAAAVAVIAAIIPVGIGALGRALGPPTTSNAAARVFTSGFTGKGECCITCSTQRGTSSKCSKPRAGARLVRGSPAFPVPRPPRAWWPARWAGG